MNEQQIIREMSKGILRWYEFRENSRILYVSTKKDSLLELLEESGHIVTNITMDEVQDEKFQNNNKLSYDYVVMISQLEICRTPDIALNNIITLIKPDGKLLVGMDNRLGLRYFCGDQDPFTDRNFDGIENYRRVKKQDYRQLDGRLFSKAELEKLLAKTGLQRKYYAVLPNLEYSQMIFSEDYKPNEELSARYFPMYNNPDTVFLEEEYLYTDFIDNNLFPAMANSFFIECSFDGTFSDISHVTMALDRGRSNSMLTVIHNDKTVEKKMVFEEGNNKLELLNNNTVELKKAGINVVEGELHNNSYVMPYIEAQTGITYFKNLFFKDKDKFIEEMDRFVGEILRSSQHISEDSEDGIILKTGYIDMIPLNCFVADGKFIFYDQEYCEENYPANVIILRTLIVVYASDIKMAEILPVEFFYERYGLSEKLEIWQEKAWKFIEQLRNQKKLRVFNEFNQRNMEAVNTNRQRMNYPANDYQRLFVNIFDGLKNKKLILFGSGNFTKRFLALYGKRFHPDLIIDNNKDKWGQKLDGIEISSPDVLSQMRSDEYKVIICIKSYVGVLKQLKNIGVKDMGIYDPNIEYPMPDRMSLAVVKEDSGSVTKPYHIGYMAGVFDLFHIGHLNMFKRAKEQCDYLIVGVVSDEGVRRFKKTQNFIPFDERIEMVRSCKYVDEAVEIPENFGGTRDAYRMYHFDVQFSGSDYENNPDWLADKEFLKKHGSDMVFFPYTQSTSSTKLKKLIDKSLI